MLVAWRGLSAGGMLGRGLLRGGRGRKRQAEALGQSAEQRSGASALRGTIDEVCPNRLKGLQYAEAVPGQSANPTAHVASVLRISFVFIPDHSAEKEGQLVFPAFSESRSQGFIVELVDNLADGL